MGRRFVVRTTSGSTCDPDRHRLGAVASANNETTEGDDIMSADRLNDTRAPDDPRPEPHDSAPVMNPTPARQGRADNRVRYILGIGIVLVVIAFVAVYFGTPTPPTP